MRRAHLPPSYAFLSAPQGFFSGLSVNAESTSGFSCHKPARCRLSGPKSTGGDHLGAHLTGGPGGLSSFGALGRVSRSGRFRNRASDPRPRTVRGSTLSRAEASGSGPAAACRSTDPGGAGFFVHRDRWLRGREDSVRPVLTGNSVKSFLKNILARRCSRTTARFRALPELCQRIRATSFSAKTSCYNLGAHRGAENHDVEFQVTGRASAECWLRIAKWPRHIPMLWAAPERGVPATGPSGCSELATSWRLFALWCGEAG